jgi:hypothetical protein
MFEIIALATIVTAAGFLQGLTGFGFGLMALPLMSLFVPIKTIIPLIIILTLFINLTLTIQLWSAVRLKTVGPLFMAAIPGIYIGVYLLTQISSDSLTIIVGMLTVGFALYQLLATPVPRELGLLATICTGLASGILSSSISTAGPPVIIYTTIQPWSKDKAKATLGSYFLIVGIATVAVHALNGIITEPVLTYSAYLLPALIVGTLAGTWLYSRIADERYRKLAIILVLLLGVMMLIKGF